MVNFSIDAFRAALSVSQNVRNISVIAHVDHGKSTLTDSLLQKAGFLSRERAGNARLTDTRPDEQLRGITIKSTGVSMLFEHPSSPESPFVINLIDSPGHVDFSSEVTAAIRCSDGALVVVDSVEGCCAQTETVLRQALGERVRPCLILNKIDRLFLEKQLDPESAYQALRVLVENVNVLLSIYGEPVVASPEMDPVLGNVCFCSGFYSFGFTLKQFARIYSPENPDRLMPKLWGDHFFDPETKRWSTSPTASDGRPLKRGFVHFILDPIWSLFRAIMDEDEAKLNQFLEKVHVVLPADDRALRGRALLKPVLSRWLHAGDALVDMIVERLPSPVQAQQYRVDVLYTGPMDDESATSIRSCNKEGPVVMYVSKMVPIPGGRFLSFGRVFSGTIASGTKIRVQSNDYIPGNREGLRVVNVTRVAILFPRSLEAVESAPAGCICGVMGIDSVLQKSGTLTTCATCFNIAPMKFRVSPVVQMAVRPKEARDLSKFVEGLNKLSQSDPCLLVKTCEETGDHIVCGAGELHLEICLNDLREFCDGMELIVSDPVISFMETVRQTSPMPCLAKSPNKHNRVYTSAEPMNPQLVEDISSGKVSTRTDAREFSQVLANQYGWDLTDTRKIWAFAPTDTGTNVLVDQTKGVQYLTEAREHIVTAFTQLCFAGPLCNEPLRGVRVNVTDVELHPDSVHRGPGQMIPASLHSCSAALLSARPTLLEPIYSVEIQAPQTAMSGIYSVLNRRRGTILSSETKEGQPVIVCKAFLPIIESFHFTEDLRAATSGTAFPQCAFDHWEVVDEDVDDAETRVHGYIMETRRRKGLPPAIPQWTDFADRL